MKYITISQMSEKYGIAQPPISTAVKNARLKAKKDKDTGKYLISEDDAKKFADNYTHYVSKTDKAGTVYSESRASLQAYKARIAKIEYEQKIGNLISLDEVKKDAFKIGRVLRDLLLNLPHKLSHELAAETNPATIEKLLDSEIRQTLDEITRGKFHDEKPVPNLLL